MAGATTVYNKKNILEVPLGLSYHNFLTLAAVALLYLATTFAMLFVGVQYLRCRSSRSQMFFKIRAPKNFAKFTGKHLYWSLRAGAALLQNTSRQLLLEMSCRTFCCNLYTLQCCNNSKDEKTSEDTCTLLILLAVIFDLI